MKFSPKQTKSAAPKKSPTFSVRRKLLEFKRVLKLTKKPSSAEFRSVAKVTAIGLLLIGLVGFTIHLITVFVRGGGV